MANSVFGWELSDKSIHRTNGTRTKKTNAMNSVILDNIYENIDRKYLRVVRVGLATHSPSKQNSFPIGKMVALYLTFGCRAGVCRDVESVGASFFGTALRESVVGEGAAGGGERAQLIGRWC